MAGNRYLGHVDISKGPIVPKQFSHREITLPRKTRGSGVLPQEYGNQLCYLFYIIRIRFHRSILDQFGGARCFMLSETYRREYPLILALVLVGTILGGLLVGYEPVGGDPDRLYRPLKTELARALA